MCLLCISMYLTLKRMIKFKPQYSWGACWGFPERLDRRDRTHYRPFCLLGSCVREQRDGLTVKSLDHSQREGLRAGQWFRAGILVRFWLYFQFNKHSYRQRCLNECIPVHSCEHLGNKVWVKVGLDLLQDSLLNGQGVVGVLGTGLDMALEHIVGDQSVKYCLECIIEWSLDWYLILSLKKVNEILPTSRCKIRQWKWIQCIMHQCIHLYTSMFSTWIWVNCIEKHRASLRRRFIWSEVAPCHLRRQ